MASDFDINNLQNDNLHHPCKKNNVTKKVNKYVHSTLT